MSFLIESSRLIFRFVFGLSLGLLRFSFYNLDFFHWIVNGKNNHHVALPYENHVEETEDCENSYDKREYYVAEGEQKQRYREAKQ